MNTPALTAILLIVGHFIGDWLLQGRYMAKNKSKYIIVLIAHVLVVIGVLNLVLMPITNIGDRILPLSIYGLAHGVQDWFIWRLYARFYPGSNYNHLDNPAFFTTIAIDQMLHLLLLVYLFMV